MNALSDLKSDIRVLQTKMTLRAAASGAIAAMVPTAITLVIWLITK